MKRNSRSVNSELQSEERRGDVMFQAPSLDRMQEVLHSPFDIATHKATFINYLELIIRPDGTPEYATPSHMMKLVEIYGKNMDDIYEEYYQAQFGQDCIDYLCAKTGCIAVWNNCVQGTPNEAQTSTLLKLRDEGLYIGLLYPSSEAQLTVDECRPSGW